MITIDQKNQYQKKASFLFNNANISTTKQQIESIEIADFNLSDFEKIGLSIFKKNKLKDKFIKEIAILPNQTCPQHMHPIVSNNTGKEETLICRWGVLYLYVNGQKNNIKARIPKGKDETFTVFNEIILYPNDKYTILPETWHWFQAADNGAVVTSISNITTESKDIFKDLKISRFTKIHS